MMISLPVNKFLLPIKAHYFLFNAGTASVVPFMSVYAKQLRFSTVTVGIIYTILAIAGMLAKTIMGGIADKYQCKKVIFLSAIMATGLSLLLMNFSKSVPTQQKMRFACDYGSSVMDTCVNNFNVTDECTVEVVTSKTASTATCKLVCEINDQIRNTVCNSWNITEYCKPISRKDLSFSAAISMRHTEKLGDCVIFRIDSVQFANGQVVNPYCPRENSIQTVCDIDCDSFAINDLVRVPTIKSHQIYSTDSFWLLLTFFLLTWISQAVVVSIGDAICFEMLGDEPNKYGYQRLWGALGWGVLSILAGYLIDFSSEGLDYTNYTPVFVLGFVILLINFINCYFIKYQQQHISSNILRDIGTVLTNLRVVVFLFWCTFVGMCTGLLWNFLLWFVEDLAKARSCDSHQWIKTLQGLIMGIQCLCGELPFFFLSGWILKRIGHVNTMSLILLAIGVRFTLYSFIPNPWWFLPIEVMNGPTFGLSYATMASYASIVAPPGTEATMQGLVGAVFEGVGVSLGSFVGGVLLKTYGGAIAFRILGMISFIMSLLHVGIEFWLAKCHVRGKDVMFARYATPQDALQMVEGRQEAVQL